jgi:hypothetical protein
MPASVKKSGRVKFPPIGVYMKRKTRIFMVAILILGILGIVVACKKAQDDDIEARAFQTACYSADGGDRWQCDSGGSMVIGSGAALVVTPGATVSLDNVTLGEIVGENLALAVPTAQTTATPGAYINNVMADGNSLLIASAATPVASIDKDGNTDLGGTLQYGASDLYPLGYASSGEQTVATTQDITGTAVVAHGLTTVTWAVCSLGEDPGTGAGDSAVVSVSIAANVVTVKAWQDDFSAATEVDTTTHCLVVGTP